MLRSAELQPAEGRLHARVVLAAHQRGDHPAGRLLHVLLREAGRVVTREHLVDAVLSRKFSPFDRSIDMHVSKVRKKLGDSDNGSDHIKTVRGVGYIFAHPRDNAKSSATKVEQA